MDTWTEGYVSDIDYTYGYYPDLNPLRVRLAFLNSGLAFPQVGTACELGFGQGLSVNLHAAASTVQWHGTDFNPSQAGFAQEVAAAAGSSARLLSDAFADFCNRTDLPDFDYIGLHGIWSWVSDANRSLMVDFVRRKLKVGGVLYISYNTMPGWANSAPVRKLLTDYTASMNTVGEGQVSRVNSALEFVGKLMAVNPAYLAANPQVQQKVEALAKQNRNYLAHEYFNRDWSPMYFSDVAQWLGPAKLSFACSATWLDHMDALNLTPAQQTLRASIPDPVLSQTVRDFLVNQQFRKDYWIKGPRKLSGFDQAQALRQQRVVLVAHRSEVSLKIKSLVGEADLNQSIYAPVLDALADHQPATLAQLESKLTGKGIGFGQLVQATVVLCGLGKLEPAQDEGAAASARRCTDPLNQWLLQKAQGSAELSYMASPVTGGGIFVGRIAQLFLLALGEGINTQAGWVDFAWKLLSAQGQKIVKDGKTMETAEENLAEMRVMAQAFEQKQLPVLRALQVV